jgi:hypothetical protein
MSRRSLVAGVLCSTAVLAAVGPTPVAREAARKVLLARGCGVCHDGALTTANPGALGVYDLRDQDWTGKMSNDRLPKLMSRLRNAPAADRLVVKRFIAGELAARARAKQAARSASAR